MTVKHRPRRILFAPDKCKGTLTAPQARHAIAGLCRGREDIRTASKLVLELLTLRDAVGDVDLVITGEGSPDDRSFQGKASVTVAQLASAAGVPTIALAGKVKVGGGTPFADVRSLVEHAGEGALTATTDVLADVSSDTYASWLERRNDVPCD